MARVVGKDESHLKRVTCPECCSIVEYAPNEAKAKSFVVMGHIESETCIKCPKCKHWIEVD